MNASNKLSGKFVGLGGMVIAIAMFCCLAVLFTAQHHAVSDTQPDRPTRTALNEARERYIAATTVADVRAARRDLIEELKKHYGGIDASVVGPESGPHASKFTRLMCDWSPILFSVEQLKEIAGEPTNENAEIIEYTFDEGDVATGWRFKVVRQTILGVEYVPGE